MSNQPITPYARIVDTPAIVRLLLLINVTGCSAIGGIYWIARGWQETTFSLLGMALATVLLFFLQKAGYTQLSGFLLYIIVSFVITFNISIGQGIYDEGMLVYPLLIVFSGLLFGKRSAVLVTGISLSQLCLIYALAQAGIVRPFEGAVQMTLEETITSIIIILVTGYIVWLVIDIIEIAVKRILSSEHNLEEAYNQTLIAWAKALELRNREDPGHSARVSSLSSLFAEHVGLSPEMVRRVWQGALLHDIGKMGIPETILLKPEALTDQELATMKKHIDLGQELIKDIDYLGGALEVVHWHHERYDGKGYPDQLAGEEIPYTVQLFSVVDTWDSLRADRPCKPAWSDDETLEYIRDQSGKKFNPEIVEGFLDLVQKFGLKENQ